jgi:SAM-dependent methyltransferase
MKLDSMAPPPAHGSIGLYNAIAADYDDSFETATHRRAYDLLAGEFIARLLPPPPALIVDVGCGTGRWASKWLSLGHRVIGIEQAPEMIRILGARRLGPNFTLLDSPMESAVIESGRADLVVAMGSVQYANVPASMIRRMAHWAKPGGFVSVYTDSLVALVLELIRMGRRDECLERLRTRRGVFSAEGQQAGLYLYDAETLKSDFLAAGLTDVACRGLLISSSVFGKEGCTAAMKNDEAGILELERAMLEFSPMADVGRHIIASGKRSVGP